MDLFVDVADNRLPENGSSVDFVWKTWSPDAREILRSFAAQSDEFSPAVQRDVQAGARTFISWDVEVDEYRKHALSADLDLVAEAFYQLPISTNVWLFRNLIDESIGGAALRKLLAYVRARVVQISGDPLASFMHPPATAVPGVAHYVHTDMQPAEVIFNAFDSVPTDATEGCSTFMKVDEFIHIITAIPTIPRYLVEEIKEYLGERLEVDTYKQCWWPIWNTTSRWHSELLSAVAMSQMSFRFGRGEGYMMHDRRWMHGRSALNAASIGSSRLHRLVIQPKAYTEARMAGVALTV